MSVWRLQWMVYALMVALWALGPSVGWAQVDDEDEYEDEDAEIDPRYARAQDYHLNGDFAEAFRIYDQILAERPKDVPVLITYGHMHWKIGEYSKAIAKLELATKYQPKHIKARQFLAQLHYHRGHHTKAKAVYESLLALDWVRTDVKHSGMIGLGKIALLEGKWLAARKHFRTLEREGGKGDRRSGKKGQEMVRRMMKWNRWSRHDSKRLHIFFSPDIAKSFEGATKKKEFGQRLDAAIDRACRTMGIPTPEPWPLYVFKDDGEANVYTKRKAAHGWDYSWWTSYSAVASRVPPEHTVVTQLVARWCSSRPLSRTLVEGFASYLAGVDKDPHAEAKRLLKAKKLRTMRELQILMRQTDEGESLRCYHHGQSFVAWLVSTYGLPKFAKLWKHFNITVNAPIHKQGSTKGIDWEDAFHAAFKKGLGVSLAEAESGWRAFLRT